MFLQAKISGDRELYLSNKGILNLEPGNTIVKSYDGILITAVTGVICRVEISLSRNY